MTKKLSFLEKIVVGAAGVTAAGLTYMPTAREYSHVLVKTFGVHDSIDFILACESVGLLTFFTSASIGLGVAYGIKKGIKYQFKKNKENDNQTEGKKNN